MPHALAVRVREYREGHVLREVPGMEAVVAVPYDPATRRAGDRRKRGTTQEDFARWLSTDNGTQRAVTHHALVDVEKGRGCTTEVLMILRNKLVLGPEEMLVYEAELRDLVKPPRPKGSAVLFGLPTLHISVFWSAVLAHAVDPRDKPLDEQYYTIMPRCWGESLAACADNLEEMLRHVDLLAAVVMMPPIGLREERTRRPALVRRIEDILQRFAQAAVPVFLLDRHLPEGERPDGKPPLGMRSDNETPMRLSREPRRYGPGVRWIGPDDDKLAERAADTIITKMTRHFGAEDTPIERIAILVDDVRFTTQDRRTDAARRTIERALRVKKGLAAETEDPAILAQARMDSALIKHGNVDNGVSSSPANPEYWGIEQRIRTLLDAFPYAVIAGSSQIAQQTYAIAADWAAEDQRDVRDPRARHFVPAIVSLDSAGMSRRDLPLSYADYQPQVLVRRVFTELRNWQAKGPPAADEILLDGIHVNQPERIDQALARIARVMLPPQARPTRPPTRGIGPIPWPRRGSAFRGTGPRSRRP